VVGIDRNRWSRSIANGGRHQLEYAIELNELLLDELADTGKHGEAPFAIATGMGALMADIMDKVDPKRKR
jgi:hypothetical protein